MINLFKDVRNPIPLAEIDIYDFIERVKNPDPETLNKILTARRYKERGKELFYDGVKMTLPCFTLNFNFHGKKVNSNIKQPTGLIYLDIDNETKINLNNPLIFASWLSLSKKGRGILVKIDGLSLDNFSENYDAISKELDIKTDKFAAKATQYTIQSFDKNIYLNEDSVVWKAVEKQKFTPTSSILKKEKKRDTQEMGVNLRYDNVQDLDFEGKEYLSFEKEKTRIAKAFIPKKIRQGTRNSIISSLAFQIRALNTEQSEEEFSRFIHNINKSRCTAPLSKEEINKIILKALKANHSELILNTERRVIFNPKSKLTTSEKRKITNKITGKVRSKKTLQELNECIREWKPEYGKITQKKVAKICDKNIKTIEKYYKLLSANIKEISFKST